MKITRREYLRCMAGVAALGLLAGCGQSDLEEEPTAEALPTVRMWGIGGITDSVRQRIQDHLNELTREKLGFEVELTMVSRNSYNEQLNIAFFQGNAPDLFAIYQQTAFDDLRNGGYLCDLRDYADDAYLSSLNIPRELWNRTRSGENCYGIVQCSETMQFYSYQMQRATAQQYGVTDTGLWDWDELHTLLTEMKRRCPEQYPLVAHYGTMLGYIGQDSLGNDLGVLIDESTSDTTVVNLYATEQYRAFCERMHAWYQEGLILSDTYEGQMSGAVQVLNGMGMGFLQRAGEFGMSGEWTRIRLSEPTFDTYTNYVFWGVSAQSRQTERAVQLLQAIFRDPDIALLLLFGEEGVDYELNEERVLQVTDSGWSGNKWAWPGWSSVLETVDLGEQRIVPEGTEVHYSPAYGFVCDMEPVSREAERCLAVVEKYNKGLLCGFLNPETEIPAFLQELQEAGINTILAEKQRQLDQWLAQK